MSFALNQIFLSALSWLGLVMVRRSISFAIRLKDTINQLLVSCITTCTYGSLSRKLNFIQNTAREWRAKKSRLKSEDCGAGRCDEKASSNYSIMLRYCFPDTCFILQDKHLSKIAFRALFFRELPSSGNGKAIIKSQIQYFLSLQI